MKEIVCEECRRRYDYEKDDFCPRCGAFNQPRKTWGVDAKGNVIRVDGVNEANHAGSFVHREVHREKDVRQARGLDKRAAPPPRGDVKAARLGGPQRAKAPSTVRSAVLWILVAVAGFILLANVLLPLLVNLLA